MAELVPVVPTRAVDLTPNPAWRSTIRDYTPLIGAENQASLDELRDVVYGMVLRGADARYIAEYFGFDRNLVNSQLGPVIKMAQAELALAIRANNLAAAFDPKANFVLKLWAAKQHAGQTDAGQAVSVDSGGGNVTVTVVTNTNPEVDALRAELDQMVADATKAA